MVHKGIELVGTSKESFSDAVENAVREAAKTLRGIKWIEVLEYSAKVDEDRISEFQAKLMVFFKVER